MAAALVVSPTAGAVGTSFAISGTGWGVAAVTVRVYGAEHSIEAQADFTPATGAISGMRVIPQKAGKLRVTASDGTSTLSTDIAVST